MGDFHNAFEAIDTDHSGEITVDELKTYMTNNNYKETFVEKWLTLFDSDHCGKITYEHYCETLGLVPKERRMSKVNLEQPRGLGIPENVEIEGSKGKTENVEMESSKLKNKNEKSKKGKEDVIQPQVQANERSQVSGGRKMELEEFLEPDIQTNVQSGLSIESEGRRDKMEIEASFQSDIQIKQKSQMSKSKSKDKNEKMETEDSTQPKDQMSKEKSKDKASKLKNDSKSKPETKAGDKAKINYDDKIKKTSQDKIKASVQEKVKAVPTTKTGEKVSIGANETGLKNSTTNEDNEGKVKNRPKHFSLNGARKMRKVSHGKDFKNHMRRLRPSITPGVILIILAGRHRGKRVVFLKQLESGLLLVTGPFKINGCPLRRVHQKMVIATKTKINLETSIEIPDNLNDEYFSRESKSKGKESGESNNIFAAKKSNKVQYQLKDLRKTDQLTVDGQLIKLIKARNDGKTLAKYLAQPFSLSAHDYPHKMVF